MKLSGDVVEWFAVPEPGMQGVIHRWRMSGTPQVQHPWLVFKGEVVRVVTGSAVTSLSADCLVNDRPHTLVFKRVSDAEVPPRALEGK